MHIFKVIKPSHQLRKVTEKHKEYYQHCSLVSTKPVVVLLGLLLIPSLSNNIINDSAEGVLVSPCVICHTRGFYPTPLTIYQNSGKVCFWGITIYPATKLLCKYKHNSEIWIKVVKFREFVRNKKKRVLTVR